MIEKAIPKTSIRVKLRRNSCLYPSFAGTQLSQSCMPGNYLLRGIVTKYCCIIFTRESYGRHSGGLTASVCI